MRPVTYCLILQMRKPKTECSVDPKRGEEAAEPQPGRGEAGFHLISSLTQALGGLSLI